MPIAGVEAPPLLQSCFLSDLSAEDQSEATQAFCTVLSDRSLLPLLLIWAAPSLASSTPPAASTHAPLALFRTPTHALGCRSPLEPRSSARVKNETDTFTSHRILRLGFLTRNSSSSGNSSIAGSGNAVATNSLHDLNVIRGQVSLSLSLCFSAVALVHRY